MAIYAPRSTGASNPERLGALLGHWWTVFAPSTQPEPLAHLLDSMSSNAVLDAVCPSSGRGQ
jgi:hypothetical protein